MGRGRAKAKQTKVARQLKYQSPDTDLAALERELGSTPQSGEDSGSRSDGDRDEYEDSRWSSYDR